MIPVRWALFCAVLLSAAFLPAQCPNDHRTNKNAGIKITDFTISGTQNISATDLDRITSDMIGSCFDEDSEEMEERVRASFQDRGYFTVEVKSLRFKPVDPLGIPKPVTLEGQISEGPQYRLAELTFVNNHSFPLEELRQQFPLKKGELLERGKVASGLEGLRKLYGTGGFLDYVSIPQTDFGSNATVNLKITIEEGPQYHMGKLDIVGDRQVAARLRTQWKLAQGDVYDSTYIDEYLVAARDLLPPSFSRENVQTSQNCPETLVEVRLVLDPAEDKSTPIPKNVPCEDHSKKQK
jgi:outer membrane protein insertion porin family